MSNSQSRPNLKLLDLLTFSLTSRSQVRLVAAFTVREPRRGSDGREWCLQLCADTPGRAAPDEINCEHRQEAMAQSSSILPLLREHAPRLTRRFFACHHCPNERLTQTTRRSIASGGATFQAKRQTPFLKAFRSQSTAATAQTPAAPFTKPGKSLRNKSKTRSETLLLTRYPKISSRAAGWWLIGSAASVYAIVVLGGLTRLTESG